MLTEQWWTYMCNNEENEIYTNQVHAESKRAIQAESEKNATPAWPLFLVRTPWLKLNQTGGGEIKQMAHNANFQTKFIII